MELPVEQLKNQVIDGLNGYYDISDQELLERIRGRVSVYAMEHMISLKERENLINGVFNSLRRFDVLEELLNEPGVTEIMINSYDNIFYEKSGCLYKWDKCFANREKLENVISQIAAYSNKTINESEPIGDMRLRDGSRVNIVMQPTSIDGPCVTIRRFANKPVTLERLIELGSLSVEIRDFLSLLVRCGYNILISGGTGSGKTTFLNALSQYIPETERVITIEDSAELKLEGTKNLVRLEARSANNNGVGAITIRDLIKTSLRMRPDRIIVGEVRGGEALELIQALNTGHLGFSSGLRYFHQRNYLLIVSQ